MADGVVEVAVGVLVIGDGPARKVLIARRKDDAVLGGYWEMPGGKVEPGESAAQCVAREFREELGLTVRVGEALPMIEHRYDHAHVRIWPFLCAWIAGEARDIEAAEHRWVAPGDLPDYRFPPANAALMANLARVLHPSSSI